MFLYVSAQESSEEISLKTLKYVDENKINIHRHFGAPIMAKVVNSDNLDEVKLLGITALPALYHEKRIIDGCDEIINFFKDTLEAQQKKHMTVSDSRAASRQPVDEFDIKETMSRMADTHVDRDDDDAPSSSDLDSKYRAALKMRKISTDQAPGRPSKEVKETKETTHEQMQEPVRESAKLPKAPIIPEDNDDQLMLDKFYSDI